MPRVKQNPDTLKVSPVVRDFFTLAHEQDVSFHDLGRRAGVSTRTILRWQDSCSPSLEAFTACVQALGYDIEIKR